MEQELYRYRCTVLRVVDGDTLDLSIDCGFNISIRERLRLVGLDAPEVYGAKASDAGRAAREFVREWVDDWVIQGGTFVLASDKYDQREKYGRLLGRLYRDGDPVSLNQALLNAALAVPMSE